MRKIKHAVQLTPSEWHYLAKASLELLYARIRHFGVSSESILCELQKNSPTTPKQRVNRSAAIDIERLFWAISVASRYVPWRSDCLVRVMAADQWLRKYGLYADFYLGVAKDERGELQAHAWLRHGDLVVTSGEHDQFSPLIEPPTK